MMTRSLLLACAFITISACGSASDEEAAPDSAATAPVEAAAPAALPKSMSTTGARVYFITPTDGATVSNPIMIEFGIEGMSVVKAGDNRPNSGHHHLLIDTGLPNLALPIPADSEHVHFGDGSTATEITLEPGEHTLQMLLGDYLHIPHNPPLTSGVVTITVE